MGSFTDAIANGVDLRQLVADDTVYITYGFASERLILITTSEAAFIELSQFLSY